MGALRDEEPSVIGTPLMTHAASYGGLPYHGGVGSGGGCVPGARLGAQFSRVWGGRVGGSVFVSLVEGP